MKDIDIPEGFRYLIISARGALLGVYNDVKLARRVVDSRNDENPGSCYLRDLEEKKVKK